MVFCVLDAALVKKELFISMHLKAMEKKKISEKVILADRLANGI